MNGTSPTFWKIPMEPSFIDAVQRGLAPLARTIAWSYVPKLKEHVVNDREAMFPPANRKVIFSCFDTFRKYLIDELTEDMSLEDWIETMRRQRTEQQ